MMLPWLAVLSLSLSAAFAQEAADLFAKAPPSVDEALRANVNKFYQAQSEGKFRAADKWVAEDSKDTFFEADKRRCKKFEIAKIAYLEDFTKANVLTVCDTTMLMPPKGVIDVRMPIASKWKVVEGAWLWYLEPQVNKESPFGKMFPGASGETGVGSVIPKGPDVADLAKMVKTDKNVAAFRAGTAAAQEITVTSELAGEVTLSVDGHIPADVKVEISKSVISGKGSSTISVSYVPDAAKPRVASSSFEFRVMAQPLNRLIPVMVVFN